jgi:hypothetical protein
LDLFLSLWVLRTAVDPTDGRVRVDVVADPFPLTTPAAAAPPKGATVRRRLGMKWGRPVVVLRLMAASGLAGPGAELAVLAVASSEKEKEAVVAAPEVCDGTFLLWPPRGVSCSFLRNNFPPEPVPEPEEVR